MDSCFRWRGDWLVLRWLASLVILSNLSSMLSCAPLITSLCHSPSSLADPSSLYRRICPKSGVVYSSGKKDSSIVVVSVLDDRVAAYAPYAASLLELFALKNNYYFLLHCQDFDLYEDGRWSKVRVMKNLVNFYLGQAHSLLKTNEQIEVHEDEPEIKRSSDTYLVWIDVDMVFLNLTYSIPSLLTGGGDMWISAEMHGASGVANTGGFVLKVNEYTRSLMEAWWASDHTLGHDQTLFNLLYRRLLPDIAQHVVILPAAALNSPSPAYLYHESHHPLLHLMGERNAVRAKVFRHAVSVVCSTGVDTTAHIDVNRTLIGQLTLDSNIETMQVLNASLHRMLESHEFDWAVFVGDIAEYRELLLSIQRIAASIPNIPTQLDVKAKNQYVYLLTMLLCGTRFEEYLAMQGMSASHLSCGFLAENLDGFVQTKRHEVSVIGGQEAVQVVYTLAMLANDLASDLVRTLSPHVSSTSQLLVSVNRVYPFVQTLLSHLLSMVGEESRVVVLENMGMLFFNRAELYVKLAEISGVADRQQFIGQAQEAYMDSLNLYQKVVAPEAQNRFHHIAPLLSLAALLCHNDMEQEGLNYYVQLIGMLEDLLSAEQQFKMEHDSYLLALKSALRCMHEEDRKNDMLRSTVRRKIEHISKLKATWHDPLLGRVAVIQTDNGSNVANSIAHVDMMSVTASSTSDANRENHRKGSDKLNDAAQKTKTKVRLKKKQQGRVFE